MSKYESEKYRKYYNEIEKLKELVKDSGDTYPIKVTLLLKAETKTDINKWRCHISGEERYVTEQKVSYYCTDIEIALHSFRESEIISIKIFPHSY